MGRRYFLLQILETNGEQEYITPYTLLVDDNESMELCVSLVIGNWYGGETPQGITVELYHHYEITESEYKILSRYI